MRLEFLIRRRGVDPVAESALHALRDLMHVPVVSLERGTLWRFDFDAAANVAALQVQLQRAACRAGRYVNTNRDDGTWFDAAAPAIRAPEHGRGCAVALWITLGEGHDDAAREYFQGRVDAHLSAVRRGNFYRLWTSEVEPRAARAQVLAAAVTRSRRSGLLLNPHVERVEVLAVASAGNTAEVT